ncbi:MAG: TerB family tellurite resistance protein [Deltaproteobacteria bacterium]|nr:TerB family tellurite resistance protein [Deltaproteobacteria bacterium]
MDISNSKLAELNQDQKIWYAELLINTILADDLIRPSEIQFMKDIIGFIDSESERNRLITILKKSQKPKLRLPDKIDKTILAQIYVELIEICISDLELAEGEKKLLSTVSNLFYFSDTYFIQTMKWLEDGLNWKNSQLEIINKKANEQNMIVSLDSLNTEQKKWYIDVMVSSLMVAGIRDKKEKNLLKIMLSSATSQQEQILLKHHVLLKHRPPMKIPPAIHQEIINQMFVEIILIFITYGTLSYMEQQHIKQLSDICRMPTQIYSKIMDWATVGALWRKRRQSLIDDVKLNVSKEDEIATSQGLLLPHPENNSIQIRKLECFVCDSKTQINAFQLKPKSQKPSQNIFGIPTYFENNEGFDFCDYNLLRVIVCPHCFFASTNSNRFHKTPKDKTPTDLADPRFRDFWISSIDHRQEIYGINKVEMESLNRSREAVIISYKCAIEVLRCLSERNRDESQKGKEISLWLNLTEVYSSFEMDELAEEALMEAKKQAELLFENSLDNETVYRCSRVLILINLYYDNRNKALIYYDYLSKVNKEKLNTLELKDKQVFNKVFGEVKNIIDKKEMYNKKNLVGFHLPL